MINIPMLRKTLEYIESHPEDWDQSAWFTPSRTAGWSCGTAVGWSCGTKACFAGTAVLLAGATIAERDTVEMPDGSIGSAGEKARELLGLDDYQADSLFIGGNNMDRLRYLVAKLIEQGEAEL